MVKPVPINPFFFTQPQDLIENLNEGIVIVDENLITTYVNLRIAHLLGYEAADLIGRPIGYFVAPKSILRVKHRFIERRRGKSGQYEVKMVHRDGRQLDVYIQATPLFDSRGQFRGSCSAVTDLTRIKQAETENQILTQELITIQSRERQRLAAELHDSICQFLSTSRLQLQTLLLNQAGLSKQCQQWLPNILHLIQLSEERARNIMSAMYPTMLEDLGLKASIKYLINLWATQYGYSVKTKNLSLLDRLENPANLIHLYMIIQELLINIGKHAKADHVRLLVNQTTKGINILLIDNGQGFNQKQSPPGLGMKLIHQRLEMLGGQWQIQSVLGRGTTVELIIPPKGTNV